ncbi:myosuppressin [Diprion similis]|uniref:myosuppressin n=1 Tax=Diprion similis TaxID=362088 RepID=UPI001EF7FE25|nr:myosuppressin [Diprion similis]
MRCNKGILALVCLTSVVLMSGEAAALPPAQCSPGFLDEVPPRIRKVCAALSTIYELGSAMETYLDEKTYNSGPVIHGNVPLPDSGVKRQDVDHVFLRFGRRR